MDSFKYDKISVNLIASISIIFTVIFFTGCSNDVTNSNNGEVSGAWLIPEDQVFGGGPGKDGIPALFEPQFTSVSQINFLAPIDLVIGIRVGDTIRGYPHPILDWHEIANDQIGQTFYSITYCPLTGTAIGWNRKIDGSVTTFGVSGLLYNTNLIPYDRETGSNWAQMELRAVNGSRSGKAIETFPLVETTWESFKQMFPDAKIITTATGFNRSYGTYPYGDYKTNNARLLFPINNQDTRLGGKVRVLGLKIGTQSKAYQISSFTSNTTIINDNVNGVDIVLVGNNSKNFAVAFERKAADGTMLSFTAVNGTGSAVLRDSDGTNYDLFGYGLDGPRQGQRLVSLRESYIAYWFAWGTFHPGSQIYGI